MATDSEIAIRLQKITGRAGWKNYDGYAYPIFGDMLERRGLVRVVKHRDHTRTYALTPAGREFVAMAAPAPLPEKPLCISCGEIATEKAGKGGGRGTDLCARCWRAEFSDPGADHGE